MIKQTTVRRGRKQVLGTVVCGVIALSLVGVAVYMAVSAVGRLGLIGRQLTMRVSYCDATAPATTSRGGTHADLVCWGFVDPAQTSDDAIHKITTTGFSSEPRFGALVEVSREPWGSWVPVDQGAWNKLGRVLSPLVPLAFAGLFAKVPLAVWRGRRNSAEPRAGASA